jgi:hypothetical protein
VGYKKIQEKRKEFSAKQDVLIKFRKAAEEINGKLAKVAQALKQLETSKQEVAAGISALNTGGVPEFEAYKKNLLGIAQGGTPRPLPMDPVEKVVDGAETQLRVMIREYEDKLAAACPKDIKPGMTFKDPATGRVFEVRSLPEQSKNPNLKGDDAIWFDGVWFTDGNAGSNSPTKLSSLKKYKYLKTD